MGRKPTRGRSDDAAPRNAVKLSVRVSLELAQRLGVEASMRRVSQSAIVEEVMGAHLARWRLPSRVSAPAVTPLDGEGCGDTAA